MGKMKKDEKYFFTFPIDTIHHEMIQYNHLRGKSSCDNHKTKEKVNDADY